MLLELIPSLRVLLKEEIKEILTRWEQAWNEHDLNGVLEAFHDDILFENWTGGQVRGKPALRRAWAPWFANHGGFRFIEEDTFIDEAEQKALFGWQLAWPSSEKGYQGRTERRRGVDILHFQDGKIIQKLTYSKTTIEIDGKMVRLGVEDRSGR